MIHPKPHSTILLFKASALLWAVFVACGMAALMNYQNAPGEPSAPPAAWPAGLSIAPSPAAYTLVMLAHPDCPCSTASLAELNVAMARVPTGLTAYIVFSKPGATPEQVRASDLWTRALRMPGVHPIHDADGSLTARLDGKVSGQTLLYGPDGRLVFNGGITGGRGHEGDNFGMTSIVEHALGKRADVGSAPVFGCALAAPASLSAREQGS